MIELTNKKEEQLLKSMKTMFRKQYANEQMDDESIQIMLNSWKENKAKLYNFFSKQPEWIEDELMLKLTKTTQRTQEPDKAKNYLYKIFRTILEKSRQHYSFGDYRSMISYVLNTKSILLSSKRFEGYTDMSESKINETLRGARSYERLYTLLYDKCRLSIGMKKSKAFLKMIDYVATYFKVDYTNLTYDLRDLNEQRKVRHESGEFTFTYEHTWEQIKAKFTDTLNPLEVEETYYISINPLDYLSMSHGKRWDSCHSLKNGGCYHAATTTTLVDGATVIVYTLSKEDTPVKGKNFSKKDKQSRSMIFLSENLDGLFQQVFYPSRACDDALVIKEFLQEKLSEYLEKENKWSDKTYDQVNINTSDYKGYQDWRNGKEYYLSIITGTTPTFKIGNKVPFLDDHTQFQSYTSPIIYWRHYKICHHCHQRVQEEEAYRVNGQYYCQHCIDELFVRCHRCRGVYESIENLILIDDQYYCRDCASRITYVVTEDGKNRTQYETLILPDGTKKYYSTKEALEQANPKAKYCEVHKTYSIGDCAKCKEEKEFNDKLQFVIGKVNALSEMDEYFENKETFLEILKGDLFEEITELIKKVEIK